MSDLESAVLTEQPVEAPEVRTCAVKVIKKDDESAVVAGYGVVFGGQDLEGDTFTPETDFMLDLVPAKLVLYDHALGEVKHVIGTTLSVKADEFGIWVEAQLERAKAYAEYVLELVEKGVIGWSSGSVGHLVQRGEKSITRWPIIEFSLTPTPAEPRTVGVQHLRSLLSAAQVAVPEALAEASEDAPVRGETGGDAETTQETIAMDTEEVKHEEAPVSAPVLEIDYGRLATEVAQRLADSAGPETKGVPLTAPAVKKVTERGFKDDAMKSFLYWIRTGDEGAVKAALQVGTDDEGGYLVPDDFYARVVAKRDERSVARRAGATVIPTSLSVVQVPVEGTSMSTFAITAEEGAVDQNEPTFGQVSLTVHHATKLVKLSKQLAMDQAANLDAFLADAFGRSEAAWENAYFLEGGGSGQPLGAVDGGASGKTATGTNAIAAAEIVDLFHSLDEPYHGAACAWTMKMATLGYLRGLTGNPFYFQNTPAGDILPGLSLEGYPVYPSAAMGAMTTGLKPVLLGNWEFYFIAERQQLSVQRLVELYAGNAQIGLLATFRRGGAPTQAEAFKYLTLA